MILLMPSSMEEVMSLKLKKIISTPKIAINVNPLPTGKPADFSGGVGEFNISSSINSKELKIQ